MRHEERHALGMWLIAALIGGFALLAWWTGRLGSDPPLPAEPVPRDTTATA